MSHEEYIKYPTGKIGKNEFCDSCKKYNSRYSVVDVIILKEGKVLLQLRNLEPGKGKWALTGGYVDWDETLEEAAIREVKEELGYELDDVKFFKNYSWTWRDPDGRQNIDHVFIAHVQGDPPKLDLEVSDTKWFDLNDLPEGIAFDHGKILEEFNASR